jgi:soluble lytic murein transglycosylase-like protein
MKGHIMICMMLCAALVNANYLNRIQHRVSVCNDVVSSAIEYDVDPLVAIAISEAESGLQRGLVSKVGAEGPMQVMRRFWCKSEPCNLIEAGVSALKYYSDRHSLNESLCRYSSGRSCKSSSAARRYMKKVRSLLDKVIVTQKEVCVDGC